MLNHSFHPNSLVPTTELVTGAEYVVGPGAFFAHFGSAWNGARSQVLKLETRQMYQQPGNPSYDAFISGDMNRAIELMPESIAGDKELYASLRDRRVEFVRCRPIAYPMSPYLQWEMRHYELNAQEGERIFCCDLEENLAIFEDVAKHDFMVFDDTLALIHDYDDGGSIQGGWRTTTPEHVSELQRLFCWIRSRSRPFDVELR